MNYVKKEKVVEIIWLIVVVALFIISIELTKSGELQSKIGSFGVLAPLVISVLKIATLVIAPLGGLPLYIISGALFGTFWGFILCFISDVVGCSMCFLLSKKFGSKVMKLFMTEENIEKIKKVIGVLGNTKSFIKARLAFIYSPEFFSYGIGLSNVSFSNFFWINSLFLIPVDLLSIYFGTRLAQLSAKGTLALSLIAAFLILAGVFSIYKDYEKTEGM